MNNSIICLLLALITGTFPALTVKQHAVKAKVAAIKKAGWQPASYQGLIIGKSTQADMLRILGKPHWSGAPAEQEKNDPNPEVWNDYRKAAEFSGTLTVMVDQKSNVISGIDLYPENLTKDDAINYFGGNYILTRYDFEKCLGNDESGPMFESKSGAVIYIEYRERGIAVNINESGKVNHISYLKEALGTASSRCS